MTPHYADFRSWHPACENTSLARPILAWSLQAAPCLAHIDILKCKKLFSVLARLWRQIQVDDLPIFFNLAHRQTVQEGHVFVFAPLRRRKDASSELKRTLVRLIAPLHVLSRSSSVGRDYQEKSIRIVY